MNAPQMSIKSQVSEQEWQLRVDTAAAYRLISLFGWEDLIYTHISTRVPGPEHHFLINPYGLMFDEITASSLIKVDSDCKPIIESEFPVNPAGFVIHSAIHAAREDVVCVMHTHTAAGVAVAAQTAGLLPISQQSSVLIGMLGYHDYEGIAVHDDEKPRLVASLGKNNALILRNHGLLTVGRSIPDTFQLLYFLQRSCEIQIKAQSGGAALTMVPQKVIDGAAENVRTASRGMGGKLAWPGLMRRLQRVNPGFDD